MLVRRSLGLRLLLGAAVLILLAVGVTGLVLSALFHDQVRAQYDSELVIHLNQLTSLLELDEGGQVRLRGEPSDPRFHSAYGGRYWQVEREAQRTLRSRSLWDQVLALPDDSPAPGELDRHLIEIPSIGKALVVERVVRFPGSPADAIRVAVALPAAEIDDVSARFNPSLVLALAVLAAGLIAASSLQVTLGLMPLRRLGHGLARIHAGTSTRLEGDFPAEVSPLVDELNGVLGQQEQQVERARAQAGDLAHGLMTSLQLLLLEAERMREIDGNHFDRIRAPVLRMQAVIEHQLARARAQTGAHKRGRVVSVAASVEALKRVMGPVATGRRIDLEPVVASGARFAGEAADLEEMLGSLLDNACKWARRRVRMRPM
jgi:signal transduction histidine kinase